MRYIEFNLGSDKKPNYFRIMIVSVVALFISSIFIKAGIENILFLNSKTTEKQTIIDNLNNYIDSVSENEEKINKEIAKNKSKWEPRRKFSNSLIHKKTFSYIKKLNKLEELLPDRAYLKNIKINYGSKKRILLTVETTSLSTLYDVFKKLKKLNLKLGKETEKNGKHISTMSLVIKDE